MECLIHIKNKVFLTEESHGNTDLIGHHYPLKNVYGTLLKDGYCETDLHYMKGIKNPIPKDTKVNISNYWFNFYGSYFRVIYDGKTYDINTDNIKI